MQYERRWLGGMKSALLVFDYQTFFVFILLLMILAAAKANEDRPADDQETGSSGDIGDEPTQGNATLLDRVDKFLRIVEQYERNRGNCTAGVGTILGKGVVVQYGRRRFRKQAEVAVHRANLLTRLWRFMKQEEIQSEVLLYTLVHSMVASDKDIFAAGNCYDKDQFKNYTLFCPYAHRLRNSSTEITVKDLSVAYKYLNNGSEFFREPKTKAQRKLNSSYALSVGLFQYRYNESEHKPTVDLESIQIDYDDGHWGLPYFDCGGGDIWMMTYTVPFFGYDQENRRYYFKGTSGIDIDLQKVDIDQCPQKEGKEYNHFAGTHKCKLETTKCVPVPGLGFSRGSYHCVCKEGYYFPNTDIPVEKRYYDGSDVERAFELETRGSASDYQTNFTCLPCAKGCKTCLDKTPCLLQLNWVHRSVLLGISCVLMAAIPLLVVFTYKYSDVKVLKAASPVLLRIILLGAFLLYCPMIVQYFEPTQVSCCLRVWMREIGFSISYGALLLKTWRISVVFRVRSAQRVKISDTDLIKRLLFIVLLFSVYLTVRMVIGRPKVMKATHSSKKHAYQCSWDTWDYCAAVAELCLLLWGIRLCIVVRKAPSEFNESRFISWAIYNETLLSLFLNITMFFLQSIANPDLLYLVLFIHTQLTTTVLLGFLFGSKAYLVYKYRGKSEQAATTINRGSKYVAAPKSNYSVQMTSVATSGNVSNMTGTAEGEMQEEDIQCTPRSPESVLQTSMSGGGGNGGTLAKDIEEEFKRLYTQLETLKQKNMKLGNPHLSVKLSAMTEAACSCPPSPSENGRKVIISLDKIEESTHL
ncbi:DgyrCDS11521 [Dimorphilus gyrociliatus]|uniref:DgyrCDS11521 n=1 Tax=Dimorphilus gyrociliatus TaxID=2664684 RepID=A0A7I8W3K7_9ANNE|nr:DgyrCDS11521 [Dimorphilus gyrociliatus]